MPPSARAGARIATCCNGWARVIAFPSKKVTKKGWTAAKTTPKGTPPIAIAVWAQVAQLVEHATENRSVGGSIPPLGTIAFLSGCFHKTNAKSDAYGYRLGAKGWYKCPWLWHVRGSILIAVYWFRRAVPADLRELFGKREEKQSLKTKDAALAKQRHAQLLSEVGARWANLRQGPRS